jgi:hypothetical protein
MARFCAIADAASRNFFVEEQYKGDEITRLTGATNSSACAGEIGKAMCSQRLTHFWARNKNCFQDCWPASRMSNMKARIGGTSVD